MIVANFERETASDEPLSRIYPEVALWERPLVLPLTQFCGVSTVGNVLVADARRSDGYEALRRIFRQVGFFYCLT